MSKIEELTPERRQMLVKKSVAFASSSREISDLCKSLTGTWYRHLLNGACQVDFTIRKWKGTSVPDWSMLNGATVLDIGSGSSHRWAGYADSPDPHFARFCAVSGADVTVIDRFPQCYEDDLIFTSIAANLIPTVLDHSLATLPALLGKKFDIIHSANFIGYNQDPTIFDYLSQETSRRLNFLGRMRNYEQLLVDQCAVLLKVDGLLDLDQMDNEDKPIWYKLVNSRLVIQQG